MVDLSLVHVMASDPLSLKLQKHNIASPIINPWGTWEELLLGRAVLKHGADNWALVSAELQSRARASFSFTPEACRAGYQAIKLRFGGDGGREGSAAHWYEELRRLRVAHLKRELEQCDSSIGSLENKIRRLQSEEEETAKGKSRISNSRAKESTEASEPMFKVVADESTVCARAKSSLSEPGMKKSTEAPCEPTHKVESHVCGTEKPCSDMAKALGDDFIEPKDDFSLDRSIPCGTTKPPTLGLAQSHTSHTDGIVSVVETTTPALVHPSGKEAPAPLSNERGVLDNASASLSQQCYGVMPALNDDGKPKQEQPLSSNSTLQMSISKGGATNLKGTIMGQDMVPRNTQLRRDPLETKQKVSGFEIRTAEILTRSHDAVDSNHTASGRITEHNNCTIGNEMLKNGRGGQSETPLKVGQLSLASQTDVSHNVGDVSAKQGVSPSLKSVNIEECKNLARAKATVYVDDGGGKSEESESLCSPRLKSSPPNKRRRSPGFGREAWLPDDDDKRMVRKAMVEKNCLDALSSLPVESADSTEGKGQEALAAKTLCLEPLTIKVKKELLACKEEDEIVPGLGAVKVEGEHSRRLSTGPLNAEGRNHSASSTENSLLHEVWGESVEAVDKEMKRANKRRRLSGRDRKRKATTFNTTGLEGVRGATEPPRQVEFAVKTESMTNSHEASESMHSPVGKMDNDTEAWHQIERLSGDSRFEKSEVGSYVDGNEDISPMSRRNRREPKVSGKLIPLLESLRTICAHRCAPSFRHNQEPEENQMYYRMVRMPIDLGMIRAKLEEGQYSGSIHFFRDLLLMVSNALVYYSKDSSEFAAATGLRECIMKEMGHVFETEVLVKQEGPSFRKRDARQQATANQGRRKGGLKLLSAMEKPSRDLALKQSDLSTSVESRRHSHQNLASRSEEGARGVDVKKHVDSPEGKRSSDNYQTTPEGSNGSRLGPSPSMKANMSKEPSLKLGSTLEKVNEAKEPGSDKSSINTLSKDAKLKHRLSESGVEIKGEFVKVGSTSKASASAPHKGIESSCRKMKAVPDAAREPVKRGVGRPPKHSQQHGLQRARDVEVPNSTRKRARR